MESIGEFVKIEVKTEEVEDEGEDEIDCLVSAPGRDSVTLDSPATGTKIIYHRQEFHICCQQGKGSVRPNYLIGML